MEPRCASASGPVDPDELDRHLRTGGLRTPQEAIDIGHAALTEYLAEQADDPDTARRPRSVR